MSSSNYDLTFRPSQPFSVGALLAEEWTINTNSSRRQNQLPSFLEMALMDEAQESVQSSVLEVITTLRDRTERYSRQLQQSNYVYHHHHTRSNNILVKILQRIIYNLHMVKLALTRKAAHILRNYSQETQVLIMYTVQSFCLHYQGASLSETMYGCGRVRLESETSKLVPLSRLAKTKLAISLALWPYIQQRLQLSGSSTTLQLSRSKLYRTMLALLPISIGSTAIEKHVQNMIKAIAVSILYTSSYYKWQFLLGRSYHYDLLSKILAQVVMYKSMPSDDSNEYKVAHNSKDASSSENDPTVQLSTIISDSVPKSTGLDSVHTGYANTVASAIIATVIAGFVQWYRQEYRQQEHNSKHLQGTTGDYTIPPPAGYRNDATCPLCGRKQQNPTVVATSGNVYCMSCILSFVQEHGSCPVTGTKCKVDHLVRLYEPATAGKV